MVIMRRRFKQSSTLEERLIEEAKTLREEAKALPSGALREELLRKAIQADAALDMTEFLAPRLPA
jgi:hypothetical protein